LRGIHGLFFLLRLARQLPALLQQADTFLCTSFLHLITFNIHTIIYLASLSSRAPALLLQAVYLPLSGTFLLARAAWILGIPGYSIFSCLDPALLCPSSTPAFLRVYVMCLIFLVAHPSSTFLQTHLCLPYLLFLLRSPSTPAHLVCLPTAPVSLKLSVHPALRTHFAALPLCRTFSQDHKHMFCVAGLLPANLHAIRGSHHALLAGGYTSSRPTHSRCYVPHALFIALVIRAPPLP